MSNKKKKKKEFGLERLRAEYHRFHNELISLRSPCCSQRAASSSNSSTESDDDNKDTVWGSTDRLQLPQEEQVSKKALVEEWNCGPRPEDSVSSTADQEKKVAEAGESSTTPRLRITATTLFTANRGQVVVDECNSTAHADVDLVSNVPRVTSPPSKSPREPTPRSDVTGAVHLPVGEMVLASSSMNIHIGEGGVSSPERTLGYPGGKLASPFLHKFIRPATARRLRLKIKDVLEKLDTGEAAAGLILGSEAGVPEARAYLQNVISALSSGSGGGTDRTECAPSQEHMFKDKENVSERAPDSFREANEQPADQNKTPDELVEANKETQCSLDEVREICTDNKLVQCFLSSAGAVPDQDSHHIFQTKETQCSPEPASGVEMSTYDLPIPAIKLQKAYNWKPKDQGKAKVEEAGDDGYAKKLLARRAQQNDEFLQRCRVKVGNLLQGYRILEDAVKNPDRHQPPPLFQKGESSNTGKETERSASTAKGQKTHQMDPVLDTSRTNASISTEGKHPSSRRAKPRLKAPVVVKESRKTATKSARKAPESEELDYDRMYEDLGDLIVERAKIEELDRVQREHLSIPYSELGSYQGVVSEVTPREEVMGAKRSRMTRSPAREPGNKLLRLNVGKTQPLLKQGQTSSRVDRLLAKMEEEKKKLPKLERLLAFKEEKREKAPRLDRLYAFKLDHEKEKNLKNSKPAAENKDSKKERLPAWVRRMTETKPKFSICEQLEREDRDRFNLSGTVKRRNVRPPESIFKAGKHINWLSTSPRQQPVQKDRVSSGPAQIRKPKPFSKHGIYSHGELDARKEQHDWNTQFSDAQTRRTDATRENVQHKAPKTFKARTNVLKDGSGSERKKQDWVVVGDFCISELERREICVDDNKKAFQTDTLVQDAEREEGEGRMDSQVTKDIPKVRKEAEHSKPSVPLKRAKDDQLPKGETKKVNYNDALAKPPVVEQRSMATSTLPDHLEVAGPSSGPSTNISCLQETDACRRSLEEELYKQSLLEVLLKNLLDEDQPTIEHDIPRQNAAESYVPTRTLDYHQRTISPRRAPDQASTSYTCEHRTPAHYYTATAMQSGQQVAEPGAVQSILSLARPTMPFVERPSPTFIVQESAQRTCEDHHHEPTTELASDRERHIAPEKVRVTPSVKPALTRSLAFKEEPPEVEFQDSLEEPEIRPKVERREQRSVGIQITGAPHAREVLHERPSVTVVPITFPILFPIQVPLNSQQQQRAPDIPEQTAPDAGRSGAATQPAVKLHGKEVQTMSESSSSSPSTPSTPVSCPEREALIEAALKPISTEVGRKMRPVFDSDRSLIIITESPRRSPRQKTQDKPRLATASVVAPTEETEQEPSSATTRTACIGLETDLIRDIGKREPASPKSDRSSLHVEEMESPRYEQDTPGPRSNGIFADEALVADPYERVIQHGSPTGSLVFEETHLLSRAKFSLEEEEDLVTMSRETLETDKRRITHIDELESCPSSPKVPADTTEKPPAPKSLPIPPSAASTVFRKEKQQPTLPPEITGKGKGQVDEFDKTSRQLKLRKFEDPAESSAAANTLVFDRVPSLASRTLKLSSAPSSSYETVQHHYCAHPPFHFASYQLPVQETPRLFPSKLEVYLERGTRKVPLLLGRQVLPSRDMKMLAELERKAAVALRGKGFGYSPTETRMLSREQRFSYPCFGEDISSSQSQISISSCSQLLSESSDSTSASDIKLSGLSNGSESGSDGSLPPVYSSPDQLSEGEVDPGEIYIGRRGDDSPEEGEAPSVGEIR